ncbi:hypothetical protein [Francisella sp. SYW-9]|uniref:hypothetical protein n=1 Tax=Francisella sp. SYW-9 TaxID=2610888 RepID=UPI00123E312B|nr:hypothetical protein [Francisella sp. SYW-9]
MQNNTKENLYTDETFKLLINSLKNIKAIQSTENDSGNNYKQKIYDTLNEIEKISNIKPSYKNFINKIITQENINQAENIIIEELIDKNMTGYTPDLKILIEKIITDENIQKTKDYFIKQFEALNV